MKHLKKQLAAWGQNLVAPIDVDRELAWRGYALNALLVALIPFVFVFLIVTFVSWLAGQEQLVAVITAGVVFLIVVGAYLVSRYKSVTTAIYIVSALSISLSFFLSLGWGVTDITTNAFYVMAIMQNSILVRGRYYVVVLGTLLVGYTTFGVLELNGVYTPPFYTDMQANHIGVVLILLFLTFLGYFTARLIDQVLNAQVNEARLRQELASRAKIAAEVQLKMLPRTAPNIANLDIAGQSIPARDVGGDFFNYHQLGNGNLAIIVGDVTGKGMSAALLMAVITGMIDSVIPTITQPAELLTMLSTGLRKHSRQSGMNAACLVAFLMGNKLLVANAGGIVPVIHRIDGQLEWVDIGGLPMGVTDDLITYQQTEIHLAEGDWVIFTTDGVVESTNGARTMLGFELFETIVCNGPKHSAQAMKNHIITQVQQFQGSAEQHDDITVVVVNVTSSGDIPIQ